VRPPIKVQVRSPIRVPAPIPPKPLSPAKMPPRLPPRPSGQPAHPPASCQYSPFDYVNKKQLHMHIRALVAEASNSGVRVQQLRTLLRQLMKHQKNPHDLFNVPVDAGLGRIVLCTTAPPLYPRFNKIFGAPISETTCDRTLGGRRVPGHPGLRPHHHAADGPRHSEAAAGGGRVHLDGAGENRPLHRTAPCALLCEDGF
jgi:hypothetical protein